ncbi:MAG: hypothetical protein DDT24_00737 [Chloroflexi bacterium]|nr:hypothetical protein [Chloroflexota bacterium]
MVKYSGSSPTQSTTVGVRDDLDSLIRGLNVKSEANQIISQWVSVLSPDSRIKVDYGDIDFPGAA